MRRWNGWGDEAVNYPVPENALSWLEQKVGTSTKPPIVCKEELLRGIPESDLVSSPLISIEPEERLRHSVASSLPDWVAKRFGRIPRFSEGVAYPSSEDDVRYLLKFAREKGLALIPYGGGTSVVGGIDPEIEGPPSLTVDLSRMNRLEALDKDSLLARFGAGVKGPDIEKQLAPHGLLLGHFPQSYELSTLGGWIAARSSGQQSLHYGRIEHHFAGGRFLTPEGTMELNPYPASAAGPDLRELVMGSEGRMGIITSAQVRVHRLPEHEEFHSVFFPEWEAGNEAVREIVQSGLNLSMIRLSNARETEANLTLAGHENLVALAHNGLRLIGQKRDKKCMLLLGATGQKALVRQNLRHAFAITRQFGGFYTGQYMGKTWQKSRFHTPYLRNTLWDEGYAIDTLESILPWSSVSQATEDISTAITQAAERFNERVYVFAHLSHLYETGSSFYITYIFRVLPDPDEMLSLWAEMKKAASEVVITYQGTISHQHGVGSDHASYLQVEKGPLGMEILSKILTAFDPNGIMNPGKLIR